jgi:hypothetical protein
MSARQRCAELARHVLDGLGVPYRRGSSPDELIAAAEAAVSRRLQHLIVNLHEHSGVTKARIAREMDIDPAAVGDLMEGGTARLGFETLLDGFGLLIAFIARVQHVLQPSDPLPMPQGELLGFSAHPDRTKVKGADALAVLVENLKAVIDGPCAPLRSISPDVKGASAVLLREGRWFFVAEISEGPPAEMARAGRDEVWHFQCWIDRRDGQSNPPAKPRSWC